MPSIIIVIFLVIIIAALIAYNYIIYKRLKIYNNMEQKILNLDVVQDFMSTMGNEATVDEKIKRVNEIIVESYNVNTNKLQFNIEYSTIVVFDGTTYVVKASNVDEKHWNTLSNLHNEEIFKDSITTTNPKYITVNDENERLPYLKMEYGRARSAMFFPLYIDNVYIGYWIIEHSKMHAFDNVESSLLDVIKENILSVFKSVSYQGIIETMQRKDQFTKLNSSEYLFGDGRKIIDRHTTSTVCMFKIVNLEEINKTYNRETGNQIVTEVAQHIKQNLAREYVFVRYMGPKFVIVFSGIEENSVAEFLVDIKKEVEELNIKVVKIQKEEEKSKKATKTAKTTRKKKEEEEQFVNPKLNFVLSKYYKGTALENVTKSLEEYIDSAPAEESEINHI